jgi:hypothetical protein
MLKDGATISKFSREALEVGSKVGSQILGKIRKIFDLNKRDDSVFRTKNGAPKILTKFKDKPYSYELLPEYACGWLQKIANCQSYELDGQGGNSTRD